MANKKNTRYPEGTRTPGSAEGERNPAEQSDRFDDDVINRADEDDEAFVELEGDEETDADEDE